MFLLDGTVITSASDLTNASACEFAFLRALDARLGRIDAVDEAPDPMLERTAKLGDAHEARVLASYVETHGEGVVEIARPNPFTAETLAEAAATTLAAFEQRADVVFQATFFDGEFVGFADFIVHLGDGVYEVQDTKLARSAKVSALLQLAAYGEQLQRLGVTTGESVRLVLGDGSVSSHRLDDILPVYRKRRERLRRIVDERMLDTAAVRWGDPRYTVCGRCDTCAVEVEAHRDLLLVATMRLTQRARLIEAGITTIDELAASTGSVPGMADASLAALRSQATLQLAPHPEGTLPAVEVYYAPALAALPAPNPGDIFFDFEGDPLYSESRGQGTHDWGLDYLFGLIDNDENFVPFWAHSHAEERQALIDFLAYVEERRERYPGMHIYHYAPYERTHLLSIAARHGVGEEAVDNLLRGNMLVDLYPLVRKSLRVGSRSYSLKKLEPLYMGDEIRESDVTTAGDSITAYADSRQLAEAGDADAAQHILDEIADYNRYDCVSTLRLRDWLLARAAEAGVAPLAVQEKQLDLGEPSPLHDELLALAGDPLDPERSNDSIALALAAAAIDYHRRENKSFWWGHFARLMQPKDEWTDTRDVFDITGTSIERDWYREGKQRNERRLLRLRGQLAPGSSIKPGDQPFALYEYPGPFTLPSAEAGARPYRTVTVIEVFDDGALLIEETRAAGVERYADEPTALTPAAPPDPGSQVDAIAEWGQSIVDAAGRTPVEWPVDAVVDLLRRVPPRMRGGSGNPSRSSLSRPHPRDSLAEVTSTGSVRRSTSSTSGGSSTSGDVDEVIAALLALDSSYLAVQGPPGTGKTYLASHVITTLVREHRWKIGVVAQSHAVVENVLDRVVAAGLPVELVAKVPKVLGECAFTELPKDGQAAFAAEHAATGFVLGGTAWDFSKDSRVGRDSLDLLVIDEAGQFSLGYTIAASVSARNLLLLGDPQQLPQVSQGTHPEPIDQSALGWISDGHDVLPAELGFFLAESRRMHPEVTAPVSRLAYQGELRSHPCTSDRELEGVAPGLHVVPVEHADNATSSEEEAARVVQLVRESIGRRWSNPQDGRRADPLSERDMIVVTPYNAQVGVVHEALTAAGFGGVRVGTVDKFQGQEAVIAIVSLAASAPSDVPRGMSFLLMKNRLNVAISRAQWSAYLLFSPALVDYLPNSADGLAELSAFITLTELGDAGGAAHR